MDELKFAMLVLVSQMLLVALGIAWVVHTALVAKHGAIYFVEPNPVILWGEIAATVLITLFATFVFTLQACRLDGR